MFVDINFFRFEHMKEEQVILVDINDRQIGLMNKMEAHEKAVLHRAFSVFIFNDKGQLMLQQRAIDKYHCGGLWTNTCCSHQRDGETTLFAAKRRLKEEMGFETHLEEKFTFIYKAPFDNGLTEHELDHVLVGYYEHSPVINKAEAASWKWINVEDLKKDMLLSPNQFTPWFRIICDKFFHQMDLAAL